MADTLSRPTNGRRRLADRARFETEQATVDFAKLSGHPAAKAVELLVDTEDALAHELDLVHQPIPDDIEVTASLDRARGDLGAELAHEPDKLLIHTRTLVGPPARVKRAPVETLPSP